MEQVTIEDEVEPLFTIHLLSTEASLQAALQRCQPILEAELILHESAQSLKSTPFESSCLLLDTTLLGDTALYWLQTVHKAWPALVILTIGDQILFRTLREAHANGIYDCLSQPLKFDTLLTTLQGVKMHLESLTLHAQIVTETGKKMASLTRKENTVLELLMQGNINKSIAQQLNVSTKTIEMHRANIMRKLEARNIVGLVKQVYWWQLNTTSAIH